MTSMPWSQNADQNDLPNKEINRFAFLGFTSVHCLHVILLMVVNSHAFEELVFVMRQRAERAFAFYLAVENVNKVNTLFLFCTFCWCAVLENDKIN